MACDKLAVRTAKIGIDLTEVLKNEQMMAAMKAAIEKKLGVKLLEYKYDNGMVNWYSGPVNMHISPSGEITVRATTDALAEEYKTFVAQGFGIAAASLSQVKIIEAMKAAGAKVVADKRTAQGRLVSLEVK